MPKLDLRVEVYASLEVNIKDFQFSDIKLAIASEKRFVVSIFRANKAIIKFKIALKATRSVLWVNIKGISPGFLAESWPQIVSTFYTHRCTRFCFYLDWVTP